MFLGKTQGLVREALLAPMHFREIFLLKSSAFLNWLIDICCIFSVLSGICSPELLKQDSCT
jgi:hypothetical protein